MPALRRRRRRRAGADLARALAPAPAIDRATGGELPVIEAGDVAAQRVQRTLRHAGLLARRRRPGRLIAISSNPSPQRPGAVRKPASGTHNACLTPIYAPDPGSYGSDSRVSSGQSSRRPARRRTSPRRRRAPGASRA